MAHKEQTIGIITSFLIILLLFSACQKSKVERYSGTYKGTEIITILNSNDTNIETNNIVAIFSNTHGSNNNETLTLKYSSGIIHITVDVSFYGTPKTNKANFYLPPEIFGVFYRNAFYRKDSVRIKYESYKTQWIFYGKME